MKLKTDSPNDEDWYSSRGILLAIITEWLLSLISVPFLLALIIIDLGNVFSFSQASCLFRCSGVYMALLSW